MALFGLIFTELWLLRKVYLIVRHTGPEPVLCIGEMVFISISGVEKKLLCPRAEGIWRKYAC